MNPDRWMSTVFVIAVTACLAFVAHAAPLTVQAEGVGKPPAAGSDAQKLLMARRAAEDDALRGLARQVHGSTVSGDRRTEWVSGLIRGHTFGEPIVLADGSVKIIAQISLDQLGQNYRTLWQQRRAGQQQITSLQAGSQALEARAVAAEAQRQRLAADLAGLEAAAAVLALQNQQLIARNTQLQAQLAQLQALAAALGDSVAQLQAQVQQLEGVARPPATRPAE